MIKAYLRLTKPGVMFGNLITTIASFMFASNGHIVLALFTATVAGTGLIISSACVINNYLDQDIDAKMERTKNRPLIAKEVSAAGALIFGIIIGVIGLVILAIWTNWLVVAVGIFGFITYVWLYGAFTKRKSVHGTLVGAISGAAPILAGYVAVIPELDSTAILLFLILFFWQMPEFYSIAIYRKSEYAKAGIPVISVMLGKQETKRQIWWYTIFTTLSIVGLAFMPLASTFYSIIMVPVCLYWLKLAREGLMTKDSDAWARKNFHFALIVLLVFSFIISINPYVM